MSDKLNSSLYAFGDRARLIPIDQVDRAERRALGPFRCIGCNAPMTPVLPVTNRQAHFRHERGAVCSKETYLHRLGKLVLYKSIMHAIEKGKPYPIKYQRRNICAFETPLSRFVCPKRYPVQEWNVTEVFDEVEVERNTEGWIADVLLSSSKNPKLKMLLEIAVTHKCEEAKIKSGLKIIEITIKEECDALKLAEGIDTTDSMITVHNEKEVEVCETPCSDILCEHKLLRRYWGNDNAPPIKKVALKI